MPIRNDTKPSRGSGAAYTLPAAAAAPRPAPGRCRACGEPLPASRWAYMTHTMLSDPAANFAALNQLGAEGWELVWVIGTDCYLKRREDA